MSTSTEDYLARSPVKEREIDTSKGVRALMGDAQVSLVSAPLAEDAPASVPVITDEMIEENCRKVEAGAANTLVTIHPDGKRSYKHDIVQRGDGARHTLSADRGEGTTDSLRLLSKEGKVSVDGLLPPAKPRGEGGRFTSKGKSS
jgi:hypothetical protein